MKCPDCGQDLGETSVTGFDKSFRCYNCGGVWMEGWVANKITEGPVADLPPVKTDINKFVGKSNVCPVDNAPLFGYTGEEMPAEVTAFKCSHCGWWWFPTDNLMKFKKAYEAKVNYLKFWKTKSEAALMVLPVLMVLLLVVGLGVSVVNIGRKQETQVKAGLSAEFRAQYLGGGAESLQFRMSKQAEYVMLRKLGEEVWGPVPVSVGSGGWYTVSLSGLSEKEVYQVQIEGKRYYFQTK